ncbi:hypothetical protein SCG7086_AL_00100 [Chlamydiales bacterium SCGC AG-110-P3]|nr:hypothetical protein SCG7086_AL_00100 [Chlamydiales bacterium SCGC AG-110-P3]
MNLKTVTLRAAALCIGMMLVSCLPLPKLNTCGDFDGVSNSLKEDNIVSLFISHGMGGYSEGDPHDLIGGLIKELGMVPEGDPKTRKILKGDPTRVYGCFERQDYCNPCNGHQLRIYFLDWRQATWDEKSVLRRIDEVCNEDCKRVPFIRQWRKQLITDVVADVSLYLGAHGDQIRYPFKQAIRWIYQDSKDLNNHEIVSIGFSLGSQMLLDALDDMREDGTHKNDPASVIARHHFIEDTRAFFLMSNQFPLVYANRMPPRSNRYIYHDGASCCECCECDTECPLHEQFEPIGINWDTTAIGHFVLEKRETNPDFQLVSFGDPNDLLNFSVRTEALPYCSCGAHSNGLIHNVDVRNVKWALFGQMVHPARAHQDYGENSHVIGMVTHGLHCKPEGSCSFDSYCE